MSDQTLATPTTASTSGPEVGSASGVLDTAGQAGSRRRITLGRVIMQVVLLLMAGISIAPILVAVSTSLKSSTELALNPLGLPQNWRFENYATAWTEAHIGKYLLNSLLVSVPTLIIVLVVSSAAAYAFAMLRFPGRDLLFSVMLIGLMMPAIGIVTALSVEQQSMGLHNTRWGLILAEAAITISLATFIMRSSFKDLPGELREAALIDGGNEFTVFSRVMLPLAKPSMMAVVVLTFLTVWNDYLLPLVLINDEGLRTIPLGLAYLKSAYVSDVVLIAASTILAALPSIGIYVVLQRQFIEGIAQGSIK